MEGRLAIRQRGYQRYCMTLVAYRHRCMLLILHFTSSYALFATFLYIGITSSNFLIIID